MNKKTVTTLFSTLHRYTDSKPGRYMMYVDVRFTNDNLTIAQSNVRRLTDMYNNNKNRIAVNLQFSPDGGNSYRCEFF